jgi:hypothetical protein
MCLTHYFIVPEWNVLCLDTEPAFYLFLLVKEFCDAFTRFLPVFALLHNTAELSEYYHLLTLWRTKYKTL